jgi:DNA sulfur modification protein DndD
MSFNFLRITVQDWLVYEGTVSIDLGPPQDGRNIWVVYGLNGYGKTSLLRAIQWVFHDQMPDRTVKDCFNHNALRAGRDEVSVAAEFTYQGRHYHLIRRAKGKVRDGEVVNYPKPTVELAIDHEVQQDAAISDKIDQILPRECQQFFFFDGLEIEKYATDVHSEDTRQAIETVLGIPEVRNLEEDLGKLSSDLEAERDQLLQDKSAYDDLKEQKEEAEMEVDASKDTLRNLRDKRDNLARQIASLQERANQLERVQDEINFLRDLRRRREELKERLDNYENELRGYLNVTTQRLVLPLLRDRAVQLTTQVNKAERASEKLAQAEARTRLLENLLDDTSCVCGRELDAEARAFLSQRLADLQAQLASSRRIQERVGSFTGVTRELSSVQGHIHRIEQLPGPEQIQSALLMKYDLQVKREEVEQEILAREKKLEGDKDADVAQVFSTLGEKRSDLANLEGQIRRAGEDVKDARKRLSDRQKALNEAARALDDKRRIVDVLQMTLSARSAAQELVERMLELRQDTIERQMTNVFRMVTNKKQEYDGIELSDDFAPRVVTRSGEPMKRGELSAGEKEVVAFSFIAGLNQTTETNAPLVMDTPFGHLDTRHRDGLLDALPKLPCQVILLATDRDLPEDELPNLEYCLGGRFDIVRDELKERSHIKPCE